MREVKTLMLCVLGLALSCLGRPLTERLHADSQNCTDSEERIRAIRAVRAINSAESDAFASSHAYQPLEFLSVPDRANVSLTVQSEHYAVFVLVHSSSCRIAFFSNDDGIIYEGGALR